MVLPLLIPIILKAVAALAVVMFVAISFDEIVQWFRSRNGIKEADKDNIAITIKQRLDNGEFRVVQGIFNKRTDALAEARVMQARQLDPAFENVHRDTELVVYE